MFEQNKHKIVYYYLAGAFALLLFLKLATSNMFQEIVETILTTLPFIIIAAMMIHGFVKYRKKPEEALAIRKHVLTEILFLLFITLVFYVLYSPAAFVPLAGSFAKFGSIFSLDTFFVFLAYASVGIVSFSVIFLFYKLYQKSQGKYQGSMQLLFRKTLYSVFFVMFFFLVSSAVIFPGSYSPITGFASDMFYLAFKGSDIPGRDEIAQKRISSLKGVLGDTFKNLTEDLGSSTEKLVTTVSETKDTLDQTISRTNDSLKKSLSQDIEDRLDVTGGTLAGDLTVEDDLVVDGQSTMGDVVPADDDSYDLGSVVDGWDNLYIHSIHGSSIITIGDGSTSHGMGGTDDLLISGDLEVNGVTYLDGGASLGSQKITNVADPTDAQDAATKAYVDASMATAGVFERQVTTLSPVNSGDNLDMEDGTIFNAIIATSNTGAHNLGPITFTNGAVSGVTSLGMSGALSGVTTLGMSGTLTVGSLNGVLKASSGIVSAATGGTDYENPLTFSNSFSRATNAISLSNDSATPGNLKYYGTDSGGAKGWFAISSGYEPAITAGTTGQYWRGDKSWQTLDTSAISGLGTIATQNSNTVSITGGSITGITDLALTEGGTGASSASSARSNLGLGSIATQDSNSVSISGGSITGITDLAVADGGTGTSNGSITGTGVLTMTPAAGNNLNVTTSGAGNFAVNTTELVVDTGVGVGIGTATPSALLDLQKAGTAKSNLDIFELTNSGNASDMDATSTALLFNQFYYDASTPAVADAGRITVGTETDWTSTATTQDSYMAFSTALDGNITEGMRINSSGQVLINALQSGAQTFPDDAGVTQWVDLPVTSAAASTVESYSAMLDGSAVLTIYGTADGSGGITAGSTGVGIGTATPSALLDTTFASTSTTGASQTGVEFNITDTGVVASGTDTTLGLDLNVTRTGASGGTITTTAFDLDATGDAGGTSTMIGLDVTVGSADTNYAALFSGGNVGIGDTTPDTTLKIVGSLCVESDANNCSGAVAGTIYAINTTVQGADYAEYFATKDKDLQPGEAVCIDSEKENAVKRCINSGDNDIMGIVSSNPSIVGNTQDGYSNNPNYKIIAMMGQISGKVSNENGEIMIGDNLTSSAIPGYMRKANAGESTVGVALQNFDKNKGNIQVLISRRNKSLTVEKVEEEVAKRITEMNVEDQVNALVASAREELLKDSDDKFAALDAKDSELENKINALEAAVQNLDPNNQADLVAQIQSQMDIIKEENKTIMDFFAVINPETLIYKNSDGNLDLLDGKLIAKEVETGKIVVATADKKTDSIGKSAIKVGETSITIETEAVAADSKVFVTAKNITDKTLAVTDIKDGEFTVKVSEPAITEAEGDLEFDWLVVGVNSN